MVYCGKPSRGCQMCRTRRIKCDETKPTCNQCAKSRRQCPGYKDEFDLVFRNETQATERRARKASRKASVASVHKADKQSPEETSPPNTTTTMTLSQDSSNSIFTSPLERKVAPSLNLPVEQRATCFFVSNFILMPKPGSTRGFLDFLVPLLRQEARTHASHLQDSFNACALGLLNNRGCSDSKTGEKALAAYSKALAGTNAALRDVEAQKADSTLAAVLLLGMFENITAKQIGLSAWGSHVQGAVQLVKVRGKKQLRTRIGLLLFIAVRTQMIIHTLSSAKSPDMSTQWWLEDAVNNPQAAQCQRVCIKVGELRGAVNRLMETGVLLSPRRTPESVGLVLDLIRRCQAVDGEAVAWIEALPDYWRYRTIAWEEDRAPPGGDWGRAEVFPGRIDVYTDFYIGSVWNMVRTSRLICHSLIVRLAAWACSPVDYRTTPEYAAAARICVDIIADIIAASPYHLGYHLKKRAEKTQQQQQQQQQHMHMGYDNNYNSGTTTTAQQNNAMITATTTPTSNLGNFACGDEDSAKSLSGDFLIWPLVSIVTQDYTTDAQRAWAQGRLKYIGNELGIRYAHVLNGVNLRVPSMLIRRDAAMASSAFPSSSSSFPSGPDPAHSSFSSVYSAAAAVTTNTTTGGEALSPSPTGISANTNANVNVDVDAAASASTTFQAAAMSTAPHHHHHHQNQNILQQYEMAQLQQQLQEQQQQQQQQQHQQQKEYMGGSHNHHHIMDQNVHRTDPLLAK